MVWAKEEPVIVLVHGAFQDPEAWSKVEPKLTAKGYRVVRVNLPGRHAMTPLLRILLSSQQEMKCESQ